jgi:two-component system, NtrC family, response regulator PilR
MANRSSGPILGPSPASLTFRARLEPIARSAATVLIRGESGCGKNLAAQALHEGGARAGGPLVVVSLAALAPSLVEAELFGHEEGAFTGAHRSRNGRFRQADGGTLVLDDVDSLPSEVQGKLLRVLQERVVEPIGGEVPIPVDVRVVCTTVRDLRELVATGSFRADLYWRLAVVELEVPPLRARLDDLPELAEALIDRIAGERKLATRTLSDGAVARLREHAWPGNVRELENALERVLVFAGEAGGRPIEADELAFLERTAPSAADEIAERALARGLRLEDIEQALIERALREQRGNLSAAARQIGLTRRALEYRLARLRNEERHNEDRRNEDRRGDDRREGDPA